MKVNRYLESIGILSKVTAKIITSQERGFLNFLRQLMTVGSPLMENVLPPLAKNVFILLGVTAGASTTDAAIQKNIFRLGMTVSIISNKEMENIMKLVKSESEESGLLIKGVSETIKNDAKEQKCVFLPMLTSYISF